MRTTMPLARATMLLRRAMSSCMLGLSMWATDVLTAWVEVMSSCMLRISTWATKLWMEMLFLQAS